MMKSVHFGALVSLNLVSSACAIGASASGDDVGPKIASVMCNSTVSNDTGACGPRAEEKCGGKARLAGVISSVEMTGRASGKLYTITARYECEIPDR